MKTTEKADRRRRVRNDLLFISILLGVVLLAGACFWLLREEGNTVTVAVDGQVIAAYPLDVDRVEDIASPEGGHNRLIIRDGEAWVETASCPDGICVGHRPIHRAGESIVCLPNRVVITVENHRQDTPDAVI